MLPRRLALSLGSLRAVGLAPCSQLLRSLSGHASASAASQQSSAPLAPPNLRLDKSTVRLVEKLKDIEASKSLYADLQAPNKTLPVLSFVTGQATGATAALPDSVFATPIRADIVHRVIQWQEKNARLTLYKGKGRAEVRGGGRKPWKQKGTGKARVGSIRSPIWVGGGVAHPPKLKEWGHLLQKKVRRLGMRCALAAKYRDRRLVVVDSLALPEGRTKAALAALAAHGVPEGRRVLLVDTAVAGTPLAQAMANIPGATALPTIGANVKDIVLADRLFITVPALAALVARVTKTD